MNYTVTASPARLSTGVLVLTPQQAKRRLHNLKALGKNRFEIVNPVEFKAGETIGYEGDIPKALATVLIDEATAKKEAAKKAKSDEKAKAEFKAESDRQQAELDSKVKADMQSRAKELSGEIEALEAQLAKAATPEDKAAIEDQINAKIEELAALDA